MAIQQPMLQKVPSATPLTSLIAKGWRLAQTWLLWFQQVRLGINASALVMAVASGTGSGSLGPTLLTLPVLTEGLYRVSVFMQVTRAASVSSSLTPKIHFTNNDPASAPISSVETGAAMTSNDPTAPASSTFLVEVASSTTLSWEFVYASVGVTTMQYQYSWVVEQLPTPPS